MYAPSFSSSYLISVLVHVLFVYRPPPFLSPAETDDIIPEVIDCPDDVVIFVPQGTTRANVYWNEPTAMDNFGDITVSQSASPGSLFAFGQSSVTYTFRDGANNVAFCIFDVFVLGMICCMTSFKRPTVDH